MLAKIAIAEQEIERRRQQKRRKKAAAAPLTTGELEAAAEERAEERARWTQAPTARQGPVLSNIPAWDDHRVKRYTTEKARLAARLDTHKRSDKKHPRTPEGQEKQRVAKREWAAKSREKKRSAKAAFAATEILSILQRFGLKNKYFLVLSVP